MLAGCFRAAAAALAMLLASPVGAQNEAPPLDPNDPRLRALLQAFVARLEPHFFDEADSAYRAIPDGELLVMQIRIDRYTIDAPVTAIKQGRGLLVPVSELARALYLAIEVDAAAGRAEGWAFREDFPVSLDAQARQISAGDRTWTLTPDQIRQDPLEVYIHTTALSIWLDAEIEVDFQYLTMEMGLAQPLAIIAQLERRRRGDVAPNRGGRPQPKHPLAPSPYQLASTPLIDAQGSYAVRRSATGAQQTTQNYTALASGDLARMSALAFVSGDDRELVRTGRLTLSRTQTDGGLLGPLDATNVELGDVQSVDLPFGAAGLYQRGFTLSNKSVQASGAFGTVDIEGDISPDWDAELYRDGVLVGAQSARAEGRYLFEDVPLFAGANEFRIVLYGPRGEVREERRSIPVEPRATGEAFTYDLSVIDQNESFLQLDDQSDPALGDGLRITAAGGVRLARWLTADLGLDSAVDGEEERRYQGVFGLSAGIGPLVASAVARADADGGEAYRTDVSSPILSQRVRLSHQAQRSFSQFGGDSVTSDTTNLAISGRMPLLSSITQQFSASYIQLPDRTRGEADWRLNSRVRRADVGAALFWREGQRVDEPQEWLGEVSTALNTQRVLARGRMSLDLADDDLAEADVSLRYRASARFSANVRAQRAFQVNADTYEARLNWDAGPFTVGPRFTYSTEGPWSALVDARFSTGWNPVTGAPVLTSDRLTAFGAVAARVFEDVDGDGRYSPGDRALEGARVAAVTVRRSGVSNAEGSAFLDRLPPHQRTDVELDRGSIEDPYLAPISPGVSIEPRPGAIQVLEIPLRPTSEIEGVAALRGPLGRQPLSGATVLVLDPDGREVARTRTGADGFYVFQGLPTGLYRLMLDPEFVADNAWRADQSSFILVRRVREIIVSDISLATSDAPPIDRRAQGPFAGVSSEIAAQAWSDDAAPLEGYALSLGTYETRFGRNAAALMVLGRFPEVLAGLQVLETPEQDGRLPLRFGPIPSAHGAAQRCEKLLAVLFVCDVVRL